MVRYLPVILVLALFIYGIIDCVRSSATDVRGISKTAWLVVIVLLPVIGVALWFALGRPRMVAPATGRTPAAPPRRTVAPDDDPEFLRNLERQRRNQAEAERLRRLKDQLDARDAQQRDSGRTGGGLPSPDGLDGLPDGGNPGQQTNGKDRPDTSA
jgi:Phospholipase_D-nuclease N-terminal